MSVSIEVFLCCVGFFGEGDRISVWIWDFCVVLICGVGFDWCVVDVLCGEVFEECVKFGNVEGDVVGVCVFGVGLDEEGCVLVDV